MAQDEVLDLVDESDQIIGTILRGQYSRLLDEGLGYIRASDIFLVNNRGELWIPTRTADKVISPSGLDFSVGGHVESGDDYLTTAVREANEEINITIAPKDLTLIGIFRRDESRYFSALYMYNFNETPQFNTDDFVSAEWMTPSALIDIIDAGVPAKPNLRGAVEQLVASKSYKTVII